MSSFVASDNVQKLESHWTEMEKVQMRDLFAADPGRFDNFSLNSCGILFDYSKNRINDETMNLLMGLAEEAELPAWIERMFSGEKINNTEGRSVLHVALRNLDATPIMVDGQDVMPGVLDVLERMGKLSDSVRDGSWTGFNGKRITDVVNRFCFSQLIDQICQSIIHFSFHKSLCNLDTYRLIELADNSQQLVKAYFRI